MKRLKELADLARMLFRPIRTIRIVGDAIDAGHLPPKADRVWRLTADRVHLPHTLGLPCVAPTAPCPFCQIFAEASVANPDKHILATLFNQKTQRYEQRLFAVNSPMGKLLPRVLPEAFYLDVNGRIGVDFNKIGNDSQFSQWLNQSRRPS